MSSNSANIVNLINTINTSGMSTGQASFVASQMSSVVSTPSLSNGQWTKSSGYMETCWWKK